MTSYSALDASHLVPVLYPTEIVCVRLINLLTDVVFLLTDWLVSSSSVSNLDVPSDDKEGGENEGSLDYPGILKP